MRIQLDLSENALQSCVDELDVLESSYDVVVVGSGASGMTAALAAASKGASVVVFEKGSKFGGSSSLSGGQIWIPNNRYQRKAGIKDSKGAASTYLARLALGRVDQSLIESFVKKSPDAVDFVLENTPLVPELRVNEPDYHPEWEGGLEGGRTIDPGLFDGKSLGREYKHILHNPQYHLPGGLHTTSLEFEMLMRGEEVPALMERTPSTLALGEALIGGLRKGLADLKVPVLLAHRALELTRNGSRISGIAVQTPKGRARVKARQGVVLASGGFEWNQRMKKSNLSAPSEGSAGCLTNTGDGILMGIGVGSATSLMDEAWWFTLIPVPGQKRGWLSTSERTLPGSIMVNKKGKRFANEAANYLDLARTMLETDPVSYSRENIPAFLVFDSVFLSKYPIAGEMGRKAAAWLASGKSVMDLAQELGVDAESLALTVSEFNKNALAGSDPAFHRGESAYDAHWGDPTARHPTLWPLSIPPYYGVRMLAGDIGTKGGLLTDDVGRVVEPSGKVIAGLYAAGNTAASIMGPGYAGSGATLGPCITFGYLAGLQAANG